MADSPYNYQCLQGHSGSLIAGSDLETQAIAREKAGYLDALCLHHHECPECKEEARHVAWMYTQLDMDIEI